MRKIRRDIPPKVKRDITFTGDDGVLVLDFLAKLVQEFDTQEMNEGQAVRLLPEFLSGIALRQYTSVSQMAGSDHGKISVWPEARAIGYCEVSQRTRRSAKPCSRCKKCSSDRRRTRWNFIFA